MMDEAQLAEIEAFYGDGSDLPWVDAVALITEVRRLRAWLDRIDRLTGEVEETCGWCEELRRYAQAALRGRGTDGPE